MSKYIVDMLDNDKYALEVGMTQNGSPASQRVLDAVKVGIPYAERPHGEWLSKPKRIQVDETDEGRIFETRQEWFCSSCGKSFGLRKPEDAFCKHCGSDNRPKEGDRN